MTMKWQVQALIITLLVGGGYVAYRQKWPPFTKENLDKLSGMFSGGAGDGTDSSDGGDGGGDGGWGPAPMGGKSRDLQASPSGNFYNPGSDPSAPLTAGSSGLQTPQVKPDENIRKTFQQELYKQIYMPYDKYPFLYQNLQGSGNIPYQGGSDPGGFLFGQRPPIQGGDVPTDPTMPGSNLQNTASQYYGLYPPGGSLNNYLDNRYLLQPPPTPPFTPNYHQSAPACAQGYHFSGCTCNCVRDGTIEPQCYRDCSRYQQPGPIPCQLGSHWNWCVHGCVPNGSMIADCPPPSPPPPPNQGYPGYMPPSYTMIAKAQAARQYIPRDVGHVIPRKHKFIPPEGALRKHSIKIANVH